MSSTRRLKGHLHVRQLKSGKARVYYAYWRDRTGAKHGVRLGLAHVRDAGRRTARGAIVWRAGDGPRPTPEHLTPQDAETRLDQLLRQCEARAEEVARKQTERVLHEAAEGWLCERQAERGLKRSTVADYEDMFERLYRDLGAETPLHELADGRLIAYFADFKAERPLGKLTAAKALGEGRDVIEVEVERWTAKPPGSQVVEVATMREAVRTAAKIGGTWKHRRRGCYRIVANGAERARRVSRATARRLEGEGWIVCRRVQNRWMLRSPAAAQTRNKYRDILAAVLDHAVCQGWVESNPLAAVKRASKRRACERILRRDDFYEPAEVDRLLAQAPGVLEEAFWLCGAHTGFRLPGEALGLRWVRHERITTTEQYLAYAPQPDLAERLTRALDPSVNASDS